MTREEPGMVGRASLRDTEEELVSIARLMNGRKHRMDRMQADINGDWLEASSWMRMFISSGLDPLSSRRHEVFRAYVEKVVLNEWLDRHGKKVEESFRRAHGRRKDRDVNKLYASLAQTRRLLAIDLVSVKDEVRRIVQLSITDADERVSLGPVLEFCASQGINEVGGVPLADLESSLPDLVVAAARKESR